MLNELAVHGTALLTNAASPATQSLRQSILPRLWPRRAVSQHGLSDKRAYENDSREEAAGERPVRATLG
jgi:hypothetical protein